MTTQTTQLFINGNVPALNIVLNSINPNVIQIGPQNIISLVSNFNSSITQIGFMWCNNIPFFPFGNPKLLNVNGQKFKFFTQEFYDFAKLFVNPVEIDLIACNMNSSEFISEVTQLKQLLPNISIEYSVQKVGGAVGDTWTMQSNNESIKTVYFTDNINNFNYSLDSTAYSTLVIKDDYTVWGTGGNYYGNLGIGSTSDTDTFEQIYPSSGLPSRFNRAVSIAYGEYTSAIVLKNGSVLMSGDNCMGQQGSSGPNTTSFNQVYPASGVTGNYIPAVATSLGGMQFTLILLSNGVVLGAGSNYVGELGVSGPNISTFTQIYPSSGLPSDDTKAIAIAAGGCFSMILLNNGTVLVSGSNYTGQLGFGAFVEGPPYINQFTQAYPISGNVPDKNLKAIEIGAGSSHSLILLSNGTVLGAGLIVYGQLGSIGEVTLSPFVDYFTQIYPNQGTSPISGQQVIHIAAGGNFTSIVRKDKQYLNTGENDDGQLGNGATSDPVFAFTPVTLRNRRKQIRNGYFHSLVLIKGTLYATGYNEDGELGNGTYTNQDQFISVLTHVKSL
jgi:alpha-tubulin suppressor-like RCC1 family protein